MGQLWNASFAISELREFAGFSANERSYIERALDIGMARSDAFARADDTEVIRRHTIAYQQLKTLRTGVPHYDARAAVPEFLARLIEVTAFDLGQELLDGFSAYRFLYERLLGAAVRPFLPAAFCAAAALPQIRPERRKLLLQSLSEAAATAPGWSEEEPVFFPETVELEPA